MSDQDFFKQPTFPGLPESGASASIPAIPEKIGLYKIESLLDKGGMSILYLGTHPETKEPTTIKVLSPKFLSHPEMVNRFINEAEIIAMTNHPNIVQLYGHGEWEGGLYIAMEFIQGISLRQYILRTPVSLMQALDIIIDISYALCHLHSHGVIHRDLKPENILIADSGAIKVIDFGIAQLLTETDLNNTQKRQLIGTPVYMSPEQRESPSEVSYPSDIYSLGIITYELILGKLSHGQIHLSLMPKGIQKILHKALQPKPTDRYQDVVDYIADISAYKNSTLLQKEKKAADPLSEMVENMKRAQMTLVAGNPPKWPNIEIGLAGHQGISISGIYYDFFDIPDGAYGIIMGESSSKGAEGVVYTAVLRGMVRALCRLTTKPVELVAILNDILFRDSMNQKFNLNYLIINPSLNELRYISCGYGNLWQIKSGANAPIKLSIENKALGIAPDTQFNEVSGTWNVGDTLVINTFAVPDATSSKEFSEEQFELALKENLDRTPQKQVEGILRKARIAANKLFQERSISLVSIFRKDSSDMVKAENAVMDAFKEEVPETF